MFTAGICNGQKTGNDPSIHQQVTKYITDYLQDRYSMSCDPLKKLLKINYCYMQQNE